MVSFILGAYLDLLNKFNGISLVSSNRLVGVVPVFKHIAFDAVSLRFDTPDVQIGHSVVNVIAAMFLRCCVAQALSPGDGT